MRTLTHHITEKLRINKNFRMACEYNFPATNDIHSLDKIVIDNLNTYILSNYIWKKKIVTSTSEEEFEWNNVKARIGGMDITNKNYDRIVKLLSYVINELYENKCTFIIIKETFTSADIAVDLVDNMFELFDDKHVKKNRRSSFTYYLGDKVSYFQYRRNGFGAGADFDIVITRK